MQLSNMMGCHFADCGNMRAVAWHIAGMAILVLGDISGGRIEPTVSLELGGDDKFPLAERLAAAINAVLDGEPAS